MTNWEADKLASTENVPTGQKSDDNLLVVHSYLAREYAGTKIFTR